MADEMESDLIVRIYSTSTPVRIMIQWPGFVVCTTVALINIDLPFGWFATPLM